MMSGFEASAEGADDGESIAYTFKIKLLVDRKATARRQAAGRRILIIIIKMYPE